MRHLILILALVTLVLTACDSKRPPPAAQPRETDVPDFDSSRVDRPVAEAFHTYKEPAVDPSDDRLVVVLHGYGANERDLVSVARSVGLGGPLVGIRGPDRAGKGWAWFPINFRASRRYPPEAADTVLPRLATFLEALKAEHSGELVVLGFSQGAMMAMMLAVEHPESLDRAIALSGTLPRPVKTPPNWNAAEAPLIYAIHGQADTVIPLERARKAQKWLEAAGAEPTYMEYDGMTHTIGPEVVHDLTNYLRR